MRMIESLRAWSHDLTGYFVYLVIIGTLGPFLFGYHLAELNAPQDVITCLRRSITITEGSLPQCIPMSAIQLGLISSAFTVGGLFGALGAGPATAKYGRLLPMRVTTAFTTVGPIAESLAPNIASMVAGRFISGVGAGAALVVVPLYISEITPSRQRGFFGAFTQIMTNVGIFTTQLLGYFLSHDSMWRLILAVGGLVGLIQLAGLVFAVDSPSWQANHGQPGIAKKNLRRIRRSGADLSDEMKGWNFKASEHDDDEQEALLNHGNYHTTSHEGLNGPSQNNKATLSTMQALTNPEYRRATLVVMMVLAAQQFCGINSIVMYGVSLLSDILAAHSALLNIYVSILNIFMTTACAPLIDVLGRKPCLLISVGGMGVSSILLGIGIKGAIPILSTIAVLCFVGSFALGLGPIPFMLSSELVGPEAVGAVQSWGLASNWIATFIVAQFFPALNEWLGAGIVYFVFAVLSAISWSLIFFLIPETKGKKDADEVWGRSPRRQD